MTLPPECPNHPVTTFEEALFPQLVKFNNCKECDAWLAAWWDAWQDDDDN